MADQKAGIAARKLTSLIVNQVQPTDVGLVVGIHH
jgi:hypothetical protein